MCTVTYLPLLANSFILTSNRDEQKERETEVPKKYIEDGVDLFFPKDTTAGGTWIGTSSKNRLVCILNGAFEKHVRKNYYKKSRGVIAKEVLKCNCVVSFINEIDLENIEPFTMVIVDWDNNKLNLYELIWDEKKKHFNKLKNEPKMWSSSTLYSNEMRLERQKWFKKWLDENDSTSTNILKFHHSEIGDKQQSILMKRSYVETVSITSVKIENNTIEMLYEDVVHAKNTSLII